MFTLSLSLYFVCHSFIPFTCFFSFSSTCSFSLSLSLSLSCHSFNHSLYLPRFSLSLTLVHSLSLCLYFLCHSFNHSLYLLLVFSLYLPLVHSLSLFQSLTLSFCLSFIHFPFIVFHVLTFSLFHSFLSILISV